MRNSALDKYGDEQQREQLLGMSRAALRGYYLSPGVLERADFLEHAERTVERASAFADDYLPDPAYHAVILHDILQRAKEGDEAQQSAAKRALGEYFNDDRLSDDERQYVSALLADMEVIGSAAKSYRRRFARDGVVEGLSAGDLNLLSNGSRVGRIPGHLWSVEEPDIGVKRMSKVAKKTNFESVVILAAEKIDHLQHPANLNESKLLHDILEAETFFAPLCEFWGLDAMAMTLKSAAAKRRLEMQAIHAASQTETGIIENQKEHIAINVANREYVNALHFGGPERAVAMLYGKEHCSTIFNIEPSIGRHPNQLAKFCEIQTNTNSGPMRILGRIKSVGSLARKIVSDPYRESGDIPMDVIGLTSVSSSVEQLTERFRGALDRLYELEAHGSSQLRQPASKGQPIYIQGSEKYRMAIYEGLKGHPLYERIQTDRRDKAFQVAKFTTVMTNEEGTSVNVEMQFMTEQDRKKARLGVTSHALRRVMDRRRATGQKIDGKELKRLEKRLTRIAQRKGMVSKDRLEVNERSIERGERLLGELAVRSSVILE